HLENEGNAFPYVPGRPRLQIQGARPCPPVRAKTPRSNPKRQMKTPLATCLWFNKNAEEAATFYTRTFPNSRITSVLKSPTDTPSGKAGEVLLVEFTVLGQPFVGLNGGPEFSFTQAVSFQVFTDTQEETDRYWDAITKDGGKEIACSWCTDKFGLAW